MLKVCTICGFETDNVKIFANHIRWKHKSPKDSEGYTNFVKNMCISQTLPRITLDFVYPVCGKSFQLTGTDGYFKSKRFLSNRHCCSSTCAHTHKHSAETKEKLSIYAKEHPTGFASSDFIQKGTRKTHSKRELEIVDYLKTNFPNDDWKQGFIIGSKKYNGYYLNPDLHSNKLRVVLEYDGIWHFKDINGQLANKQATDRALVDWCKENNYRLIRVDEDLNITDSQIAEAIYNKATELELFGSTRYSYLNI